jgi:hypothetical protein
MDALELKRTIRIAEQAVKDFGYYMKHGDTDFAQASAESIARLFTSVAAALEGQK